MTFLNPALLIGLSAAALPVLIHLFSRRRYRNIDFSSLRFLKQLQRQQMRRLQLRQWLLLLLRTLAIAAIALAFTRPAFLGTSGFGKMNAGRINSVVILDGSASMLARDVDASLMQRGKEVVQQLGRMMNAGDRLIVIAVLDDPLVIADFEANDIDERKIDFEALTVWDGSANMTRAIESGLEILSKSQAFRSEIFIVSDFFSTFDLPELPQDVSAFIVPITPRDLDNLSISEARILNEILEPGQPINLEVTLNNHGSSEKTGIYYSVFLDGQRVGENVATIAADGEVTNQHQLTVEKAGLHSGLVQLEEIDALAVDNRYYFCFSVPEAVKVLLVEPVASSPVLRMALKSVSSHGELIQLTSDNPSRWDVQQLGNYNVIIFNDPPDFTSSQKNRLVHFLEAGGGILLLPGNTMDQAQVNRTLLEDLDAPLWSEMTGSKTHQQAFRTWKTPDFNDAIFKGMFREGGKPTYPKFYQTITMTEGDKTLISYDNGSPFLALKRVGQGQLLVCSSSPDPNWSDWSKRGIFAPMMHRIVLLMAGQGNGRCFHLTDGDDFVLAAKPEMGSSVELIHQNGTTITLPLLTLGKQAVFQQHSINPVGIYTIRSDKPVAICTVNVPDSESTLKLIDLDTQFQLWLEQNAITCSLEEIETKVEHSRYGRELWKAALLFGLLLLVGESALGRVWGKQNHSDETSVKN